MKIDPDSLPAGVVPGPRPVVLVSCGDFSNANLIPLSCSGQLTSGFMYISIRPGRYSNELIRKTKKFAINYMDAKYVKETDYCGMVSGANEDKFKSTGLTKEKGVSGVPIIKEAGVSVECKLKEILSLGDHEIFIGEVVSIDKKAEGIPWLVHDGFTYYGNSEALGGLFRVGRTLKK